MGHARSKAMIALLPISLKILDTGGGDAALTQGVETRLLR